MTNSPQAKKSSSNTNHDHEGFIFRLIPTPQQEALFEEMTRAAHWGFNAFTEAWQKYDEKYRERKNQLLAAGVDARSVNKVIKKEAETNPALKKPHRFSFEKDVLTPEIRRHRKAAKLLWQRDHGTRWSPQDQERLDAIWSPDTEDGHPFLHIVARRCHMSGIANAAEAMKNYYASKTGQRKGQAMGKPQRKTHRSRKSVTIHPDSRMGPKGFPPPQGHPPITGYKHLYLANLFSYASNPNKKDRMLRVRVHGSTRRLVKALQNRPDAKISNFTISQKGGYWYVAVMVKSAQRQPSLTRRQKQADTLGIDIGIHNYLSLSDGPTVIQLPPLLQRNIKRSKNLRKKLARSQKGSNRRRKLIATIKRVDHELELQRNGFVHQITAELARNYALIGIEDLNVKSMTRSAKGTIDAPGTNVRAKSSLNRRMLEGIPGEFRRQLEYKTKRTGAALEVIDRFYPSSKTCSRCGWKNEKLSLSNRQFTCLECGLSLDRDHNAALNIAAEAERKHLKDTKSPKPSHD